MGKIQENLVLTDEFTAAFTRFLTLGESAVGATERINSSINMMGQSSNAVAAAGFNTLNQKITELSGKIQEQGAALQALGDAANSISGPDDSSNQGRQFRIDRYDRKPVTSGTRDTEDK